MVGTAAPISKRLAALALCALIALGAAAGALAARKPGVRFTTMPRRALQGDETGVAVSVRSGARCTLSVRYAGGRSQSGLMPATATAGHAGWRWQVPFDARPGPAKVLASCGSAGRAARTLMVVGTLIPARVDVTGKGFSVRNNPYGGSTLSYGLLLKNESPHQDALNVNVLVNFVMADNRLLGSASQTVASIGAGQTYAYGGDIGFPGAAPIDRLEVVIQIGERARGSVRLPAVTDVRVLPDPYDANWLGSIEGELSNNQAGLTLTNASFSAVVLDGSGKIVGGGTGYSYGTTLPPGARVFFKLTGAVRSIPTWNASSAIVSVTPGWRSG